MKILLTLLASLFVIPSLSFAKSRLGEYYFGFGYAMANGGKGIDADGDFLNLSATSPASDSADFNLFLSYGNVDVESPAASGSSWELGLDFIYHYDEYVFQNGMFRPFAGVGLSYLSEDIKMRMGDDGFTWKFLAGTEILFTDYLSMSIGGNFKGLWSDFGENDFLLDIGLSWWITDVHGVAFEYNYAFDQEVDFIGLKYLYSWQ